MWGREGPVSQGRSDPNLGYLLTPEAVWVSVKPSFVCSYSCFSYLALTHVSFDLFNPPEAYEVPSSFLEQFPTSMSHSPQVLRLSEGGLCGDGSYCQDVRLQLQFGSSEVRLTRTVTNSFPHKAKL